MKCVTDKEEEELWALKINDTKPLIIGLDPYFEMSSSGSAPIERELKFTF